MRLVLCILVVATLSSAPAAQAGDTPDMLSFYPKRAQALMVEGKAEIACTVTAEGAVTGCTVIDETPPGYGFGEAAVKMSVLFKMRPKANSAGAPMAGVQVRLPVVFKLPSKRSRHKPK